MTASNGSASVVGWKLLSTAGSGSEVDIPNSTPVTSRRPVSDPDACNLPTSSLFSSACACNYFACKKCGDGTGNSPSLVKTATPSNRLEMKIISNFLLLRLPERMRINSTSVPISKSIPITWSISSRVSIANCEFMIPSIERRSIATPSLRSLREERDTRLKGA